MKTYKEFLANAKRFGIKRSQKGLTERRLEYLMTSNEGGIRFCLYVKNKCMEIKIDGDANNGLVPYLRIFDRYFNWNWRERIVFEYSLDGFKQACEWVDNRRKEIAEEICKS